VFLALRTVKRQGDWHDQRSFVESTIRAGGNSPRMLMNLANVEFADGHQDTAISLYREALRRAPEQPVIWFGFASVLFKTHDFAGARAALDHAEKSPLLEADVCRVRAAVENAESGHDPGDLLRKAISLAPKNWPLRKTYIEYLEEAGRPQQALHELQEFLKEHDFRAESWRMLGALLEEAHQPALAVTAYREAAARDVRDTDSRAALQRLNSPQG
jgi:predicted Zn-dependent protease